jgi:hypothetical protein
MEQQFRYLLNNNSVTYGTTVQVPGHSLLNSPPLIQAADKLTAAFLSVALVQNIQVPWAQQFRYPAPSVAQTVQVPLIYIIYYRFLFSQPLISISAELTQPL